MTTTILALDLGTTTGWAMTGRDGLISGGSESFKPQRFEGGGMRYLRFKRWLTDIKQCADGLDWVVFEEVCKHAGVDAAHAYGGFMAHLTAWCEHHQIPYQGVPVGTIKKYATGKGNAGKAEMIAAAWHKQGIVVVPLDEIYDEWDRAFLSGIATKLYGARTTASCKSTPWAEGEVIDRGDGLPVGTSPGQMMIEKNAGAARAVRDALEAVGGSTSPAGLALWYVAGLGKSVREWALRQGWAGKAISLHEAKGILIAGLGVLARYYGHDRSGSARSRHPQRNSAVP